MKPFQLTRRAFLHGTAGALVALPCLAAQRAYAAAPKRLLIMAVGNGTAPEHYWPTAPGATPPPLNKPLEEYVYRSASTALDTGDHALSPILKPLELFRKDITLVEGLDNCDGFGGHRMYGALLTGRFPTEGNDEGRSARGMSVDQVLAGHIGKDTRFPSLQFGSYARDNSSLFGVLSWYGDGKGAPAENDPYKMFARLFAGTPQTQDRLAQLVRDEKRSVLDFATTRIKTLEQRLGGADRAKLQNYFEALRSVEKQLAFDGTGAAGCSPASVAKGLDIKSDDHVAMVTNAQVDMVVAALACDMTRVITLQVGHEGSDMTHPWLGVNEGHHSGLGHSPDNNFARVADMIKVGQWHAGVVADLIGKLKAVPEGSGTLFDNTLVVWVNGMTKGSTHLNQNQPTLLAGGFGGAFKTGRYIRLAENAKRSYGDMWWEVLRAAGVNVPSFGEAAEFHNGLPQIRS